MTEYSPILKTMFVMKNILRITTVASIWGEHIVSQIFVLGHYLFWKVNGLSQATLLENNSHLGTDNAHGQTSKRISEPNRGYCLHITMKILDGWKNNILFSREYHMVGNGTTTCQSYKGLFKDFLPSHLCNGFSVLVTAKLLCIV